MFATRPLRNRAAALLAVVLSAGCGSDHATGPGVLAGTYNASTFQVTPDGKPQIDVLAAGGTLSVTIGADNAVTGTLFLPASVTGGSDVSANMAGTVVQTGNTIQFQQSSDSFVRDLTWTIGTNTLTATSQHTGTATFTITLTRQ